MIDLKTYLEYRDNIDKLTQDELNELIEYNKNLIDKYPFLLPRNKDNDEELQDYDGTYTELDSMPKGWRIAFSEKMLEEIKERLVKEDKLSSYRIVQIMEKGGGLRGYDAGCSAALYDIIAKYELLSKYICIRCGNTAKGLSRGYVLPYCNECAHKVFEESDTKEFDFAELFELIDKDFSDKVLHILN